VLTGIDEGRMAERDFWIHTHTGLEWNTEMCETTPSSTERLARRPTGRKTCAKS
jgi:hypothetical protein